VQVGEQNGKLVTTHARQCVVFTQDTADPEAGLHQQGVAHRMSKTVVHVLEIVKVQKQNRYLFTRTPGMCQGLVELQPEEPPIGQPREFIVGGLVPQGFLKFLALGQVADVGDGMARALVFPMPQ
jgi:hypothetical protein